MICVGCVLCVSKLSQLEVSEVYVSKAVDKGVLGGAEAPPNF